jgi:pimeloyl-ACP methyl ester carboxylesterase
LRPTSFDFIHYVIWRVTISAVSTKGYVRAEDADIHFIRFGKGPAALLLHGGLSNRLCGVAQIPGLVRSGRQVVLPGTRGYGESELGEDD